MKTRYVEITKEQSELLSKIESGCRVYTYDKKRNYMFGPILNPKWEKGVTYYIKDAEYIEDSDCFETPTNEELMAIKLIGKIAKNKENGIVRIIEYININYQSPDHVLSYLSDKWTVDNTLIYNPSINRWEPWDYVISTIWEEMDKKLEKRS